MPSIQLGFTVLIPFCSRILAAKINLPLPAVEVDTVENLAPTTGAVRRAPDLGLVVTVRLVMATVAESQRIAAMTESLVQNGFLGDFLATQVMLTRKTRSQSGNKWVFWRVERGFKRQFEQILLIQGN